MVRSQHLKDTTTQHITTHMHGYKKQNKKKYFVMYLGTSTFLKLKYKVQASTRKNVPKYR